MVLLLLTADVRARSALDGVDPNANGLIRCVVVQSDGKILVGGDFTTVSPNGVTVVRNRIGREVTGPAPTDDNESAIVAAYAPGWYTAIGRGPVGGILGWDRPPPKNGARNSCELIRRPFDAVISLVSLTARNRDQHAGMLCSIEFSGRRDLASIINAASDVEHPARVRWDHRVQIDALAV